MAREYKGDLSHYLDGLDTIPMQLKGPPEETFLRACVEPQLRKCKQLELDFKLYDRAPDGAAEKTVQWLYDEARAHCRRKELHDIRDALLKPSPNVTPIKGKGDSKGKDKDGHEDKIRKPCDKMVKSGSCSAGKDCRFAHSGPEFDAARAKAKAKAKPKAEPKTTAHPKIQGGPPAGAGSDGRPARPPGDCLNLKRNNACRFGDTC
eukprot:4076975-Pyramimonas_sp.AAC.1